MQPPLAPKIYHIVHMNRLPSIIDVGSLLCDAEVARRTEENPDHGMGTAIGMSAIKRARLTERRLNSHPDLFVGQCVPFYFCPRSVMLYVIYRANHCELTYRGGQEPIVHLEADLRDAVSWAEANELRWAFTLSNAASVYTADYSDLDQLSEIDWEAVRAARWAGSDVSSSVKEGKQAEFLLERSFPWVLVTKIGVQSQQVCEQVKAVLTTLDHGPRVEMEPDWYY